MLFPLRARGNPLLERLDFFRRERLAFRRHPLGFIGGADPRDECAVVDVARHDRVQAGVEFGDGRFGLVESQAAFVLVGTVATKAAPGQKRLHIAHKADGGVGGRCALHPHRDRDECAQR